MTIRKIKLDGTIKNADEYGYSPSDDFHQKKGLFLAETGMIFDRWKWTNRSLAFCLLIFVRCDFHNSKSDCELNQMGNVVNLQLFHDIGAVRLNGTRTYAKDF